jgi:hypothetical protein
MGGKTRSEYCAIRVAIADDFSGAILGAKEGKSASFNVSM